MDNQTLQKNFTIPNQATIDWLLDSDPAIRWQVMHDLLHLPEKEYEIERSKFSLEGLGAQILAQQNPNGEWSGVAWNHGWNSTFHVLTLLREFGLDPTSEVAIQALKLVRENVTWKGCGPEECNQNSFFEGEIEPCINGQVAASGAYFGQDVQGIIDRLLGEQLADGGWNCDAEFGSIRSSFNSSICVLEGLLEYETSIGGDSTVKIARLRGQEFLLERHLFKSKSTGKAIERDRKSGSRWTDFAFPSWWHYDILRGLDYLKRAGVKHDERVNDALEVVLSKRRSDGRWNLDIFYPGDMLVNLEANVGQENRWITLRALRVLSWFLSN